MNEWRKLSGDQNATDFLMKIGERNGWKLHRSKYHADDHAVGQFYLSLYEEKNDPAMLKPTQERFDWILANPKTGTLEWTAKPTDAHHRWGWCDALFMAPPVWARLTKITGDQKYLDFMDQEYHATYDLLWDTEDHLFWRDSSYFEKREANGRKLYWARGNGWVFGGLALMIPDLPEDWKGRQFYIELYKQMAESVKKCQRDDGTWSMGLLGGKEAYPIKETSGTSFFTYGLAWGINNGLLDRAEFEPVVLKAWAALTQCVTEDGLLGHVQPVGAAPGDSYADKSEVYGVGAFLAAGAEVYKLVGGEAAASGKQSAGNFTVFMKDGGWCWYQDPRAIVHDGKLFIGSVKGNGSGPALVGVYDIEKGEALGTVLMHDHFDKDDHNSPVFHVRPDGSVLAVYAKHNRDKFHYSRISDPSDSLKWSDEFKHMRKSSNPKDQVTYMNLYEMSDEGLLYNFYRGINFNPTFVTSSDHGKTWSNPVHFFRNEVGGRHRPYARYAGNGKDTVYVSITDAHPRNYGNSLYYFEFRDGNYYKADGSLIKALADGPLLPSEAELVFKGSGTQLKPKGCESIPFSAWTSSIAIDAKGRPHIAYTLYLNNDDHRYRIASWNGKKWIDREVAFGGTCLYQRESSYTGLISLDPADPSVVFISTDVDPTTGKKIGGPHEIYRAKISENDDLSSIRWKAVTKAASECNIRPVVVRDRDQRVVLWQQGRFTTFTDYDLDTVGFVEEAKSN
jgi:rhamnogalacturonyl hydrolase YesR